MFYHIIIFDIFCKQWYFIYMLNKKCESCASGTMKLKQVVCSFSGKDKGRFWRCESCGADEPEFSVEVGDKFVDISYEEEYHLVWSSHPSVYVEHFKSLSDVNHFMYNILVQDKEFPLYLIRKSDFKVVEIQDALKELQSTGRFKFEF